MAQDTFVFVEFEVSGSFSERADAVILLGTGYSLTQKRRTGRDSYSKHHRIDILEVDSRSKNVHVNIEAVALLSGFPSDVEIRKSSFVQPRIEKPVKLASEMLFGQMTKISV